MMPIKNNSKAVFTTILLMGIAIGAIIPVALASSIPLLPCEISGTVTINGEPAPAGTIVVAYIDNLERGRIIIRTSGIFGGTGAFDERIVIQGEGDDLGKMITFLVNDIPANNTIPFVSGESYQIDLDARLLRGDLNQNDRIDIGDVAKVAWMAAGLIDPDPAADFNSDGGVDAADAARIAYYYVGKNQVL
ncbi:hypothetical protein FTO68_08905 [Methanocalculus taiwanensis]|uniref:Dockerin domain-containing protein n=1 Tax=Methanocalculus taiwanensis TaxID=106207 RepID=A0ABD4TJI9_9EURY|nr:hypothetical protein [Methanocalculus taiwanensis]MCQ1539097.1 hypothetical protein [Methanocalculus taiwanensis]